KVTELRLLDDAERRLVVDSWNPKPEPLPQRGIHELFEDHVRRTPHAMAVAHGDRTLTYAELNARANRVAHALLARGVRVGDAVGVLLERSFELVSAELGILKAGAAYVPLDPAMPWERQRFMLEDSGAKLLVTTSRQALPEAAGIERVSLDELGETVSLENPRISVFGDALAYVMYTSGSTGTPKGVMVPHRGVV